MVHVGGLYVCPTYPHEVLQVIHELYDLDENSHRILAHILLLVGGGFGCLLREAASSPPPSPPSPRHPHQFFLSQSMLTMFDSGPIMHP
jgi:hypothetical protein